MSDSTTSSSDRPRKRRRANSWDGRSSQLLRVYIVQPKLDEKTVAELYSIIDEHDPESSENKNLQLQLCLEVEEADIIITNIHMHKRLERHVPWKVARQKSIVTPEWLRQSAKCDNPAPCGEFAALTELHDETAEHCPNNEHEHQDHKALPRSDNHNTAEIKPTSQKIKDNWRSKYACTRASPMVCQNQDLAVALNVLARSRELDGLAVNSLAYERAVAIIKSYPHTLTQDNFEKDVRKIPGIGSKVQTKVQEFINTGIIQESETMRKSERYQALNLFASIYGVGPSRARQLYDSGLRTIEDLERYFDIPPGFDASQLEGVETLFTPNGQIIPNTSKDTKIPAISIKAALALKRDFAIPIPRAEVEEMHNYIMEELDVMQKGCVSTIVGGYRRGKTMSNDVDIVISHSNLKQGANIIKGLCARFTQRLYKKGSVTHVMHLSGFHSHDPLRVQQWDSLEKALTVFRLPKPSNGIEGESNVADKTRLHRRLDLIFAPPEAYWTAVIGWSGSKMFQRDLRLWAKVEKGMKFDSSGLTRRHDSKLFIPKNEEDVFKILGLEWIDPTLRNANV